MERIVCFTADGFMAYKDIESGRGYIILSLTERGEVRFADTGKVLHGFRMFAEGSRINILNN